jgi:hypothetical protein
MVDDNQIKEKFGEDVYNYLKNKSRGGKSNQKGGAYEGFFAVYQIALAYPLVRQESREIFIETQVDNAFVDDLMVEDRTKNHAKNFQLKNCDTNLTWNDSGNKNSYCLWEDFLWQYKINRDLLGKTSSIVLVLSSETNFRNRSKNIPKDIQDFTQVCLFHSSKNLRELLRVEPDFKNAITTICAKPDSDKLETAACQILARWLSESGKVSVSEIMQKIVEDVKNPICICTFDTENIDIDPEVRGILEGIGIFIEISGGYLNLEYPKGLSKKTYRHALGSEEFKAFEKWLKEKKPSSWEDIKILMMS